MDILHKLERAIAFSTSVFLALVFIVVVFLRYVFETDLFAYEEWVLIVAFLMYFIGGGLASRSDTHIKADIVVEHIRTEHGKRIYAGFILLIEAAIVAALTWYAGKMVLNEFARWPNIPTTTVYKIPLAVPRFFIFVGFALMTLHSALLGFKKIREGRVLKAMQTKEPIS